MDGLFDWLIDWCTHCFRVTTTTDPSHATRGHFSSTLSWRWTGIAVNMTRKAVSLSVNKPFSPRVSINFIVYFFLPSSLACSNWRICRVHQGQDAVPTSQRHQWGIRGGHGILNRRGGGRFSICVMVHEINSHDGIVLCNHMPTMELCCVIIPFYSLFAPVLSWFVEERERLRFGSFAKWSVSKGTSSSHFFLPAVFDPDWYRSGKNGQKKFWKLSSLVGIFLFFLLWCEEGWWVLQTEKLFPPMHFSPSACSCGRNFTRL